jgi:hypothetical protein
MVYGGGVRRRECAPGTAGLAQCDNPGAGLVPVETGPSGVAAPFAGLLGGDFDCVDECAAPVGEVAVEFAFRVEAVGEVDAESSEAAAEGVDLVVRGERGEVLVESAEQCGLAGPDGGGPGGDLPFSDGGRFRRHARHGRLRH